MHPDWLPQVEYSLLPVGGRVLWAGAEVNRIPTDIKLYIKVGYKCLQEEKQGEGVSGQAQGNSHDTLCCAAWSERRRIQNLFYLLSLKLCCTSVGSDRHMNTCTGHHCYQ